MSAEPVVIEMTRKAASDELVHADLCAELVGHFGQKPVQHVVANVSEVAPSDLSARERVLYEVVALSCVTETLSAALLGTMVEQARDARVKAIVHRILCDEIEHGRLGWAHLSLERPRGYGRVLGDYLPAMLHGAVGDELFRPDDDSTPENDDVLAGVGALRKSDRKAVFGATMRTVVFPGLERFGIDTSAGSRWLDAAEMGARG
jgi:hypothetical protein